MHLYFDNIIFSLQKVGGISAFWSNLLVELQAMDVNFKAIEYQGGVKNIFRQRMVLPQAEVIRHTMPCKTIRQMLDVRIRGHKNEPFVFHSSYYRICTSPLARNVVTVHDFTYENHIARYGLPQRARAWLNRRGIERADRIVCVSENTRRDLLRLMPAISEDRVTVIHNGVSEDYHPTERQPELSEYVLFVGGRQSYKNFSFAVDAVAASPYKLLICGNPLRREEILLLENRLGAGRYKTFTHPSNQQLNLLYNSAHCLLYPSSYEGFGIPILEAQRAGCPVIAIDCSSIPEVMGNGGIRISKTDIDEFLDAAQHLDRPDIRASMISEGFKNSQRFSWQKMASAYKSLYESL